MVDFKKLQALGKYDGYDKVISSHELKQMIEERKASPVRVASKIPLLDKYIEGFEGGELIIISGKTGHGKTTLCRTFTHSFFEQAMTSLWLSYEETPRNFLAKFGDELPFFCIPQEMKANQIEWVEARILEAIVKYEIKAVFIDHLHFIVPTVMVANLSTQIGFITQRLKRLAVEYNVIIFLVCHTQKIPEERERPTMAAIRDSSFISQDANTVLLIWRLKNKVGEARLGVDKCRRTGTLGKVVKIIKVGDYLREMEEEK